LAAVNPEAVVTNIQIRAAATTGVAPDPPPSSRVSLAHGLIETIRPDSDAHLPALAETHIFIARDFTETGMSPVEWWGVGGPPWGEPSA